MSHSMNFELAREKMHSMKMDAILICSPEGFFYATGFSCMLLDLYRQAPLGLFLLSVDENRAPDVFLPETDAAAIKKQTDFIEIHAFPVWWESYPPISLENKPTDFMEFMMPPARSLPAQHEPAEIFRILAGVLKIQGPGSKRIGVEFEFISAGMLALLKGCCPEVQFVDGTSLMNDLRMIKTAQEIDHLRQACKVTEAGLYASGHAICQDATLDDLTLEFKLGVLNACKKLNLIGSLGEIGGQPALGFFGPATSDSMRIKPGNTVKYDMQASINHYYSDIGRTFLFGEPLKEQKVVYKALLEAHDRMHEVLRPGRQICEVYQAARQALDRHGLFRHARGHFGHAVGLDRKIEEPPFISANEKMPLQKGMVLAVETPFYCDEIGKFQIEDMILITGDGFEIMNELSKDWTI